MKRTNGQYWISVFVVMVAVMALMLPAAAFSDGQDKLQIKAQDQLKDGSCRDDALATSVADMGDQTQDRLQDGSCDDDCDGDQDQDRERKNWE
ncbi:hypothetical protein MUP29_02170 [bacterium]|nr:hypothetical protein [bacterium]